MKINSTVFNIFDKILRSYGLRFVESELEAMKWTITAVKTDINDITVAKAYTIEILLSNKDHFDLFESNLDQDSSLIYKIRNDFNAVEIDSEEVSKDRVKITFTTNLFYIGG